MDESHANGMYITDSDVEDDYCTCVSYTIRKVGEFCPRDRRRSDSKCLKCGNLCEHLYVCSCPDEQGPQGPFGASRKQSVDHSMGS